MEDKNMQYKTIKTLCVSAFLLSMLLFSFVATVSAEVPEVPGIPKGPAHCQLEKEYRYRVGSVSADGEDIEYFYDWGDGTNDSWVGPWTTHTWTEYGRYEVRIKARDATTLEESDWSEPLEVVVDPIEIIGVTGGQGITIGVQNHGDISKRVDYRIELVGGTFPGFHLNKIFDSKEDDNDGLTPIPIGPGQSNSISVSPSTALGRFKIKVELESAGYPYQIEETFDAFIFFFYVMV
jgi:hypothetical protein